jgi:hypothetical protein
VYEITTKLKQARTHISLKSGPFKKIKLSVLVLNKADITIISLNVTCSRHDTAEKLLIWH